MCLGCTRAVAKSIVGNNGNKTKKEKNLMAPYAATEEAKTSKRARKETCYIYKGSHVV